MKLMKSEIIATSPSGLNTACSTRLSLNFATLVHRVRILILNTLHLSIHPSIALRSNSGNRRILYQLRYRSSTGH